MIKRSFLACAALALALLSSPVLAQQVWKWSQTSASNSTADPAVNWSTGMAPSAVSPSARAMMAAVAKFRDDIGGRLTTAGTSTAYTLTSNSSLASTPNNGQLVCFTVNATNGAAPTLAVDSGTAFPIRIDASNAVPAASLVSGSPYCATFNSSASAWVLHSYYGSPTTVPVGAVLDYTGTSAPNSNFAMAYGQCISRTTYAPLFAIHGTTFSSCDGSTTFGLPDTRDRVVAGLGNMGGSAANRITAAGGNFDSTVLGATGGAQNHTLTTAETPAHTHTGTTDSSTVSGTTGAGGSHSHTGTTDVETQAFTHTYQTAATKTGTATGFGTLTGSIWVGADTPATTSSQSVNHTHTFTTSTASTHTHAFTSGGFTQTFTSASTGGGGAHTILPPVIILSKIIRIF